MYCAEPALRWAASWARAGSVMVISSLTSKVMPPLSHTGPGGFEPRVSSIGGFVSSVEERMRFSLWPERTQEPAGTEAALGDTSEAALTAGRRAFVTRARTRHLHDGDHCQRTPGRPQQDPPALGRR